MSISENIKNNNSITCYSETPDFTNGILNIEISGKCNERCVYCVYSAKGLHENAAFIDDEFFFRITKEAKELGIAKVGLYMRGEPLCNPKVYEYVEYLKNTLEYEYVYISTNGLLLNEANMEKLASAGIDSIKFSVAGFDRESFIQHHGVDGYEVFNKNIENCYRHRERGGYNYGIGMFIIVTKYNDKHLEDMITYYSQFCDEVISDYVIDEGPIRINGLELLMQSDKKNEIIDKEIPCKQLFNRIVIDEKGYLLTCCYNIDGITRVMDLSNHSLLSGIYSEEMKAIRKMHMNKCILGTVCDKCMNNCDKEVFGFLTGGEKHKINLSPIDYEDEIISRFYNQ